MKEMLKARILAKRSVSSVMNERKLLSQLSHRYFLSLTFSFLVNMHYAFQDRENLYMVLDLMPGGDLRYHIGRKKRLPEAQTKFVIACLIHGLEYMHTKGVIHRDIKPENLVVDSQGYVRITDLGIARLVSPDNSQETSGTPGYMGIRFLIACNTFGST